MNKEESRAYMKAYRQQPEVKARLASYMREWNKKQTEKRNEERQHPEFYKKKAKEMERNIKELLAKHNLSHLKSAMILDGIRLDNELKKRKIRVSA